MRNIIEHQAITWVDMQNPEREDVEYLRDNFQLHPVVLEQIIPPSWGTRAEHFASNLFLVLFFPVYSKERKETRPRELDVVVGPNFLVTSHYNSIVPLKSVFDECNLYEDLKEQHMGKGAALLLYHVLHQIMEDSEKKVGKLDRKLAFIEESIFEGKEQEMLKEISFAKADIINLWRIIRPQKGVFTSLRDLASEFFGGDLYTPYFSNLRNHWARIMSALIVAKETITSLEQTNNALLTDKINEILKLLTIFAVIVFPLTLLSSIFGMNTKYLPIVGHPQDFWIVSGIMAGSIIFMIIFFKKKKWL